MQQLNNKFAVIYARYSSDRQNEQSIEGQIRVVTEYAKKNNIEIIDSYIDRALTGRSDDRPEFQKMIQDAQNGLFGTVLVYKYDRFSRNRLNSLLYKSQLKSYGVKVISVTEYISDDPQGILFESIIDGYAEYYSAELAQKVKRGNRESRLKGNFTGGPITYGYRIVNKKYEIVPEDAEIIKKIFKDVISGKTFKSICRELNSKGITHNGNKFIGTYIRKVITNEKYIGLCKFNDDVYDNIVPAIIDKETFYAAQDLKQVNFRTGQHYRAKTDYLLSGKAYCGYCGAKIIGEGGTGRHGECHYYYKCYSRKKRLTDCQKSVLRKDDLENMVVEAIKTAVLESSSIEDICDEFCQAYNSSIAEDNMLSLNEKALARNKKETDNIINAIASGLVLPSIKEKLEALEEEKEKLEVENLRLKSISKKKLTTKDVKKFLYKLMLFDTDVEAYKKELISKFLKRVDLFDDRFIIHLLPKDDYEVKVLNKTNKTDNNDTSEEENEWDSLKTPLISEEEPIKLFRFKNWMALEVNIEYMQSKLGYR